MAERVARSRLRLGERAADLLGRTAASVLTRWSRRNILPHAGRLPLRGLRASTEVRLDSHGVPHVRAGTDDDAFRALGYCHARDRFFQMDMLRRGLAGRLSETVGNRRLGSGVLAPFPDGGHIADADRLMRVLGLDRAAQQVWDAGDAVERALLTAYVEGVNAALHRMRRWRPVEHRLLRLSLEDWRPVDSILIAKGMALGLSFKWRSAPVFGAIAERLADRPEHLAQVLPAVPGEGAHAICRTVVRGLGEALAFLPLPAPARGSNAWVVGKGRTESGRPLLASDPHLDLSQPGIWYLASVSGADYRAVGATLPGLPGVVIGRTPTLAWGLTNAMLDDADLWVETLDDGGRRYRVDDSWRALDVETQVIKRRGAAPEILRVRRTHRGPLVTDAFPDYAGPPLSLRMTLQEATGDLTAFLALGRARTVADALVAADGFGAPAQNLLLADAEGRAAYRLIGLVPRRLQREHPAALRDGSDSTTDWTGFVDPKDVPRLDVGADDQVVSANHPPVDGSYPYYLSHLYEPGYRATRIEALLAGRSDLCTADMERIQADAVSVIAPRFWFSVLSPYAEIVRRRRPVLGPILDRLLAWRGDESVSAAGTAAWHLVYHHLVRRTFSPVLGEELVRHWSGLINLVDEALFQAFDREDSVWAPPAVRATLLEVALTDAMRDLERRGHDLDTPWGAMHTLELRHPLGAGPSLARALNRGPFAVPGGPYSVCSGQYRHAKPGPAVVGSSYLHVVDMANPEGGRMIMPGGQSGHVGSHHYDDLTPLWRAGERLPMRLDVLPDPARVLEFVPA